MSQITLCSASEWGRGITTMRIALIYDSTAPYVHRCASIRSRYTGKERDAESGLDYFGARYYASSMGRWTSPDWADKPEAVPYSSLSDPQSLNLYSYVRNNPVSSVDADGHDVDQKPTNYVYYPVSGATAQEALSQASSHFTGADGNGYAGMTTPSFSLSFLTAASGTVGNGSATVTQTVLSDTVTLNNTVQLPQWTGAANASPADQATFNGAVGQLKSHEDQHVGDSRAAADKLDKSLPGTKATATAPTAAAAGNAATAQVQKKVDAKAAGATADMTNRAAVLDKNTDHGRKPQ